ncbi:MAG: electron transfer flavoprotein subunit alpha/FixB family protein [Flavobacteriaceae bacterium]|nr:electron transfer flavoprotein subunit alpha/FixB family protein [Flavobacteriaceae bacterium]MDG1031815.1 electron transfer flavoprotein subunit alpha/FixB family protein [Flavobacteriaceae bacterium]MDG1343193.1 electron transfer flavoprotein subunit alpha/FixB family protein [Flavobacteriaceae bacterium]
MPVLTYIESSNGKIKKNGFELASYSCELAKLLNTDVIALAINVEDVNELSNYGVKKIIKVNNESLNKFSASSFADIISKVANHTNSNHFVLSSSLDSKYLAPLLAAEINAAYVNNVIGLPTNLEPFTVKRTAFTNKAFSDSSVSSEKIIIGLSNNSFGLVENSVDSEIEELSIDIKNSDLTVDSSEKVSGQISIADADIVVSAGRGMKGPENWNLIEDLANTLGAATACSKPVSDMGWRPHSEHVGQTGKPVATNLYIAIGISGAIQHLAGINSSKIKVVINNDPEAPFFKAADYGVVGDAFDVVPRLNEKLKEFKAQNS